MDAIKFHKTDTQSANEYFEDDLELIPARTKKSKRNYKFIKRINEDSIELLSTDNVINKLSKEEKTNYLKLALTAQLYWLQLKSAPGKEFAVDIDGKGPVMLKANDGDSEIPIDDWYNAFFLSKILRQKDDDFLYSIPIEKIPTITKDYRIIFHNTLLFYHSFSNPDISILNSVIEYIDKHFKNNLSPKTGLSGTYDVFLLNNEIRALKSLIENKPEDFNHYLHKALEDHKAFWGQKRGLNKGEAPLCDNPDGFISWPLTALAAMAHDKGFKVEVESDYIPKFMVEGNFSG